MECVVEDLRKQLPLSGLKTEHDWKIVASIDEARKRWQEGLVKSVVITDHLTPSALSEVAEEAQLYTYDDYYVAIYPESGPSELSHPFKRLWTDRQLDSLADYGYNVQKKQVSESKPEPTPDQAELDDAVRCLTKLGVKGNVRSEAEKVWKSGMTASDVIKEVMSRRFS